MAVFISPTRCTYYICCQIRHGRGKICPQHLRCKTRGEDFKPLATFPQHVFTLPTRSSVLVYPALLG